MNMGSSSGSDDLLSLNLGFPSTIGSQITRRKSTAVVELEPSTLSLSLFDFGGEQRTTNKAIFGCYDRATEINYSYSNNNNIRDNNKSRISHHHHHHYSSPPSSVLTSLSSVAVAVNVNVNVKRERDAADFDFDVRSVSASKAVTVGSDVDDGEEEDNMTTANHINNNGRVTDDGVRKKLRLSKDQSALLEESFKHHTTLNPKQKLALANQLNLRPRQVEVWFQNRRARTKLKQTEVDCEFLRKCCETLKEENRRLEKELQELRSIKQNQVQQESQANSLYMMMMTTSQKNIINICPSCGGSEGPSPSSAFAPPNSHFFNPFASTATTAATSRSAGTAC